MQFMKASSTLNVVCSGKKLVGNNFHDLNKFEENICYSVTIHIWKFHLTNIL